MEYLFNELKQYDLKEIKTCDLQSGNYYIGLNQHSVVCFYYLHKCKIKGFNKFNRFYEFGNKTFDILTVITETFFDFCHTLKNTKQRIIDFNDKKYNSIYLKLIRNTDKIEDGTKASRMTDKTGLGANIMISLEYKEIINLCYSSYKITKNKDYAKFNKDFMKFINKSKYNEEICYYY